MPEPLLEVVDLRVHFDTPDGVVKAVDGVSFSVKPGETLGIVGESGAGKSVASLTVMGLTRGPGVRISGQALFDGWDLLAASDSELRRVRGEDLAMTFQDPLSALHPFYRVGTQIVEAILAHRPVSKRDARTRATELLELVGIPEPGQRVDAYPHELSGGMRQRAMIAMALANDPRVLIADEPTTALDVTVQAQILELIRRLQRELGMAVVMITHDLGVIAESADDVAVMYAGRIVERADVETVFAAPEHPYTWGLLESIPSVDHPRAAPLVAIPGRPPSLIHRPSGCPFHPRCPWVRDRHRAVEPVLEAVPEGPGHSVACLLSPAERRRIWSVRARCASTLEVSRGADGDLPRGGVVSEALLEVRDLVKHFPITEGSVFRRQVGAVRAVDGVSFDVARGETLGLVGESGCGKSTIARLITRLLTATSGTVRYRGEDVTELSGARLKQLRREMQVIFQDPYASLNPRRPVGAIIAEPFHIHRIHRDSRERRRAVQELMEQVGLNPEHHNRYPHEFSGGQRQRVGIARALALGPKLVVADEPVSALDVSIQAQILNLLRGLQRDLGLTIVFIAHDLSVVRHMCDRVAVIYLGKIVEIGAGDDLYRHPLHPYTQALLAALPVPDPALRRRHDPLAGDLPSPTNPPPGCRFHTRCPKAEERCGVEEPALEPKRGCNLAACHFPLSDAELAERLRARRIPAPR